MTTDDVDEEPMPPREKAVDGPTVEDLRHEDTRGNIPTGELAGFVAEPAVPPVRYARDPSLDPQLVWRGKDERDSAELEVPSVPIRMIRGDSLLTMTSLAERIFCVAVAQRPSSFR